MGGISIPVLLSLSDPLNTQLARTCPLLLNDPATIRMYVRESTICGDRSPDELGLRVHEHICIERLRRSAACPFLSPHHWGLQNTDQLEWPTTLRRGQLPPPLWRQSAVQAGATAVIVSAVHEEIAELEKLGPSHLDSSDFLRCTSGRAGIHAALHYVDEISPKCSHEPPGQWTDLQCDLCHEQAQTGEIWIKQPRGNKMHAERAQCFPRLQNSSSNKCPVCGLACADCSLDIGGKGYPQDDIDVTVIATGLGASDLDHLVSQATHLRAPFRLLVFGLFGVPRGQVVDWPALTALAASAWGTRFMQQGEQLAVLGRPLTVKQPKYNLHGVLTGISIRFDHSGFISEKPKLLTLLRAGTPTVARVLAQHSAIPDLQDATQECQRIAESLGLVLSINSNTIRPGKNPNTQADGMRDILSLSLKLHGDADAAAHRIVFKPLLDIPGTRGAVTPATIRSFPLCATVHGKTPLSSHVRKQRRL